MRYASVCSGIEAATQAWHPLGWKPVWFSEIERFPNAVLAHRYPSVPNLGDMENIDGKEYRGAVDLLVGGTPCQSFSIAGLRGGIKDERGNLALRFCRLVDEMRPKWVVWENVPGVLSSNGGRDFASFLSALHEFGYDAAWRVLDAQYFGLAQRRKRVFLVASPRGGADPAEVLLEPQSLCGDSPPSHETREEAGRTLGSRSPSGGSGGFQPEVASTIDASIDAKWGSDQWVKAKQYILEKGQVALTLQAKDSQWNNPEHETYVPDYMRVRRLTPTECERLMGFPDGYTHIPWIRGKYVPEQPDAPCPDGARFKALGNSMAVPVMRWIGNNIQKMEEN